MRRSDLFAARRPGAGRLPRVLLLGGVIVAGSAALLGAGPDKHPAAQIGGAPLTPGAAASTASGMAKAEVNPHEEPAVDLAKIVREGDHYVSRLADGRRAVLTLEPERQELAEKLRNESRAPRGAIVLMAKDGRILAIAGRRTDEPKGGKQGTPDWRLATEPWGPSASIFKLVTASALVTAGVDPDEKVCYHGGTRSVLEHNLQDDKRDNRCEDLAYAVAHSQNAIIGKLAYQKLEPSALAAEAAALGWTAKLPGPLPGLVGEFTMPEARDLEHARIAAGFKNAKLSVLGGALIGATFADQGKQPTPRLVASIDGVPFAGTPPRRMIPADTAKAVAKMMAQTCTDGSAAKVFLKKKKVAVAGKTGTLTRTDPFYMEHSWFVGFAPVEQPELVVSVLLGNPESWHLRGHEAAKRMVDRAFDLDAKRVTSASRTASVRQNQ
jgi:cell division protein FtsI/penicillin-binding protein 2